MMGPMRAAFTKTLQQMHENLRIHNLHIPYAFPLYNYHLLPNWTDGPY